MTRVKISIVVPVYNVECYLSRCIKSIVRQSFIDWELILVDDGSLDNSAHICEMFAKDDTRIIVVHKNNGGVSSARNIGIEYAKGEYITFVDGDDFLDCNFLEELFFPCREHKDIDFVHAGCVNYFEDGRIMPNQKYDKVIGKDRAFIFRSFRGLVFSKLFSLDIIKKYNIRFDERMKYGEDMTFTIDYLIHSEQYALIESVGYYYVQRQGSAMNTAMRYEYEREMHAFIHRYCSVNSYIYKFNLSNTDSKMRLIQTADSFYTALYSLYTSGYNFSERSDKYNLDVCQDYLKLGQYISSYIGRLMVFIYRYAGFTIGDCSMRLLNYIVSLKHRTNLFNLFLTL